MQIEREEALAEGRAEGLEKGLTKGVKQTIQTLLESLPLEQVAELLKMPLHEAQRILQDE